MLLIRAVLFWAFISAHVVGGAALFRRFFPRESPWIGFFAPGLALVVLLNFIEHLIALPTLLWLLPFTTCGLIWSLIHPVVDWKGLRLPTGIFLASFAFTLIPRCIKPDIFFVRDGIVDLSFLASFCMGQKVPPPLIWYPPLPFAQYYTLGHYAMSVVTRLFGLDVGTGYNLSTALLGAFDCTLAAGAAWCIGRHKIWITILAPFTIVCAATGSSAYFWFTAQHYDPAVTEKVQSGFDDPACQSALWHWLPRVESCYYHELIPPGAWSWLGCFHSTSGGQFLVLLLGLSMAEVLRRRSSNFPWICLGVIPLLTILTSTWALILEAPLLLGTAYWILNYRLTPQSTRAVLMTGGVVTALLIPSLSDLLTNSVDIYSGWTFDEARTPLVEFLLQWWPILLPMLALVFIWSRLTPVIKTLIFVIPMVLLVVELYTIGTRPDWTGKLWGYVFGIGWIVLFPTLCRQKGFFYRGLTGLLVFCSIISLIGWVQNFWDRGWDSRDVLHLEGNGVFRLDPMRGKTLAALSELKGKVIIPGRSHFMYNETAGIAAFSGTYTYVQWSFFCDQVEGGNTYNQATKREKEVDALYEGTCDNPLLFLRTNDIAAVVVYPLDNIRAEVVAKLKQQLAPYYEYDDFSDDTHTAGIFIYGPQMEGWPADAILHPLPASPAPAVTSAPSPNIAPMVLPASDPSTASPAPAPSASSTTTDLK